jgi:hypothetical protein
MGISIEPVSDGMITVRVSGELTQSDWIAAQQAVLAELKRESGKASLLVLAESFTGWKRGEWSDSPFQAEFDRNVERMAIVGEQKWEDLTLLFVGKGLRRIPIEFFQTVDMQNALKWLRSSDDHSMAKGGK